MAEPKYVGEILLIENSPGDVRLTKEMFKEAGFYGTYSVATDGDEALDFLYQRDSYVDAPHPDIIFLDWHFPRKSGEEILTKLNNDERLKQIPVIVLTGTGPELHDLQSDDLGADGYVLKPLEPDDLIRIVQEFSLEQALE
ncbi:response regulator [Haloterrigena turkmenica]|uniref:response regulator n=1 Tax=Haloterrigena turkmenica TaxID=62320 RepID=UPI000A2F3383|nr:response regulator [Haloterrigena turkmenica]